MIAHKTPLRVSIYTGKSLEIDLLRRPVAERGFSLIDSFDPLGIRLHGLMLLRNNSVCPLYIDKPYSKGVVSAICANSYFHNLLSTIPAVPEVF